MVRRTDTIVSRREVREMFDTAAPRYDLLNRVLSLGIDRRWRRCAVRALGVRAGDLVIDVCGGSGDLAGAALDAAPGARALVVDFSRPMLRLAAAARGAAGRPRRIRPALTLVAGDATRLPIAAGAAAAVVIGFGIRNIQDRRAALAECRRVLRPGGRLAVLEFALPRAAVVRRPYLLYLRHVLPRVAGLLSPAPGAYRYLGESILDFPTRERFAELMAAAGFRDVGWRDLSLGIAVLFTGHR